MGLQISSNYTSIKQNFSVGPWNVYRANSKSTNELVSLWIIDNERLSKRFSKRAERDSFLDECLASIQTMRKLRHPKILKIYEVSEKKPDVGFASEPVESVVSQKIEELTKMDAVYIAQEMCEVLGFLNDDISMTHLGLSPDSILLTSNYSLRLFNFKYAVQADINGKFAFKKQLLNDSNLIKYQAPEVLRGSSTITTKADVFSFGLLVYYLLTKRNFNDTDNPREILESFPTKSNNLDGVQNNDFREVIQACLNNEPSLRPSFSFLAQKNMFQSMYMKALRYIDHILIKEPADKFKFYKGIAPKISDFSPNLQKYKILPILLNDCKADVRYAPVLIYSILKIGEKFPSEEFMNEIWMKISFLTTVSKPIEVLIALLQNLKLLLEKIGKQFHKDYVYPIVFSALQSNDIKVNKECLNYIDLITNDMNENGIQTLVLPKLLTLGTNSTDSNICAAVIHNIINCIPKINNDSFASEMLPKLCGIWQKNRTPIVGEAVVQLFSSINASFDILMRKAIPVAAEIAGTHVLNNDAKNKLCEWMISVIDQFKNKPESSSNKYMSKTNDLNDNPFSEKDNKSKQSSVGVTSDSVFGINSNSNPNVKNDNEKINITSVDIFGSGNNGNNSKANDIFASNNNKNNSNNNMNIFGSGNNNSKARDIFDSNNSNDSMNIFGSGNNNNNSKARDIFGSNNNNDSRNIFGSGITNNNSSNNSNSYDMFGLNNNNYNTMNISNSAYNNNNSNDINVNNNSIGIFGTGNNNVSSNNNISTDVFNSNNNSNGYNIFGTNNYNNYIGTNQNKGNNDFIFGNSFNATSNNNSNDQNDNFNWTSNTIF